MGQAAIWHGIGGMWLQPLGFKACFLGLLDRQILCCFCLLLRLNRFVAQPLLLNILCICLLGISHRSLCCCCLLGAITSSSGSRFCFQSFACSADRLQPVLTPLQLLGQITAQLALACPPTMKLPGRRQARWPVG